ncbi:MAG: MarR family winged helix-turn-helix transcriptional regulator [Acidimicrobiia bacterium]
MGAFPQPDLGPWIHRVAHLTKRAMAERLAAERWLQEKGFRPPCIGALHAVAHHQPMSQRELSERLGLDPSDTVDVVDILERAGYVSRHRDPADRRRHALTLTAPGEEALARLGRIIGEIEDEILAPLDPAERRELGRLLRRVADHHQAARPADAG